MSERKISLALTPGQVARVVENAHSLEDPLMLPGPEGIREMIASPLLKDPAISKSLLLGLLILISFPEEGERANKEVAEELELAASTTHRYINTLVAAGLLEQNKTTHQYRRPLTPG